MPDVPKIASKPRTRRRIVTMLTIAILVATVIAPLVWWKFFSEGAQSFGNDQSRFNYGSLGSEAIAGIPYPIFMILPRVFPDLVEKYSTEGYGPAKPGYGGYGAFGLAWEEGQRLPIGFSIKRLGYERVTVNCALCHTTSYRLSPHDTPHFAFGGPSQALNLQGLLRFLFAAARDRRFSAARLLPEIKLHFDLDTLDDLIYATVLIPGTRSALHLAEHELGWMNSKPARGPGRDDAFNLPKFVLTQAPWDDSVGNTDFPAVWRLDGRSGELFHVAGEARDVYAVVATSAIGVGSLPIHDFKPRNDWIESFIGKLQPPPIPARIDESMLPRGKQVFDDLCADCHAANGKRTGTAIPLAEIGTDPEHVLAWHQKDADRMNAVVRALGARDANVQGAQGGYVARPLVGLWLLAPYLHNGSVPTLRDLLSPVPQRSANFYRGYDVVDLDNVGFVSTGSQAAANGYLFDTRQRGNGNAGHTYGTDVSEPDRRALLEYLKTL
jgi:mono/diheme cytochrome c family protein